jgi:hypothetical protein
MKKWAIIGGSIGAVVLLIIIVVLFILGEGRPTPRLRDISIIFISLFAVISTVLLAAILGAILWLVLTLRDRVIPLLETLTATATRVKGTTEFVTEQAVQPIISVAGTMARMRAMTRTVTGGKKRPVPRTRRDRQAS